MKTRRLTTILTSAYLSAMLATSVAPIRSDATLAATINPMAAQKALQNAVSSLNISGWTAAATVTPPAAQATPAPVPAINSSVMTGSALGVGLLTGTSVGVACAAGGVTVAAAVQPETLRPLTAF